MNIKASIILTHFGSITPTISCIKSIISSKIKHDYEIVLVDNSDRDNENTFKKIFSKIKYFRNPSTNKGFSSGIKLGFKVAKNEYLVVLDNDTNVLKGWLDNLLEPFYHSEKVGMTTSEITDPDASDYKIVGGKVNILGFSYPNKIFNKTKTDKDKLFYGITSWCVKKSLMEKVNMDTSYKFFSDDADIGYKIKSLGYDIVRAMKSKVLHFKTAKMRDSVRIASVENYKTVVRNKDYIAFSFKNLPLLHFIIFFISFILLKIIFLPYRILVLKQTDVIFDFIGIWAFIKELKILNARKRINSQIREVRYLYIFKQYSRKLLVSSLIFK